MMQRHIPEEQIPHPHCFVNLKMHIRLIELRYVLQNIKINVNDKLARITS